MVNFILWNIVVVYILRPLFPPFGLHPPYGIGVTSSILPMVRPLLEIALIAD